MEISNEEEYDVMWHQFLSVTRGEAVRIQRLDMADDIYKELDINLCQIFDQQYALLDIREMQCKDLAKSMGQQEFYYWYGMMKVSSALIQNTLVQRWHQCLPRKMIEMS